MHAFSKLVSPSSPDDCSCKLFSHQHCWAFSTLIAKSAGDGSCATFFEPDVAKKTLGVFGSSYLPILLAIGSLPTHTAPWLQNLHPWTWVWAKLAGIQTAIDATVQERTAGHQHLSWPLVCFHGLALTTPNYCHISQYRALAFGNKVDVGICRVKLPVVRGCHSCFALAKHHSWRFPNLWPNPRMCLCFPKKLMIS